MKREEYYLYLRGKDKDIRETLATKLLDDEITFEEKELIAERLTTPSRMELALEILVRKLWHKENLTTQEKELLSTLFPKRGKGRPATGPDNFNSMIAVMFKAEKREGGTDEEVRERIRPMLLGANAITTDAIRKRVKSGEKQLNNPFLKSNAPIATSLQGNFDKEIIKGVLLEIK